MTLQEVSNLINLHIEASLKLKAVAQELTVAPDEQSVFALETLSGQYNAILSTIIASGNLTV